MANNIFKAPCCDGTQDQMAACLPVGRAWALKNVDDSNIRKLINCLSVAHNIVQQHVELLDDEFRILNTYDLLEDWEQSVGIPDLCISAATTLAQRRQAVIDRLRKQPIVTLSEMQAYVDALFPGVGIVLYPGHEYYTFEYGFEIPILGSVSDKFVLVATVPLTSDSFEYEFEMIFEGAPDVEKLVCLLDRINPANVYIKIEYVGAP